MVRNLVPRLLMDPNHRAFDLVRLLACTLCRLPGRCVVPGLRLSSFPPRYRHRPVFCFLYLLAGTSPPSKTAA